MPVNVIVQMQPKKLLQTKLCCHVRYNKLSNVHNCNCNYILFTKLPWPGDSEGTFRSSSQAATCPSVYHTRWRLHSVPLIAERQARKLWIPIFIVFGLTRPGIELVSTASVADVLSTRPLIGSYLRGSTFCSFKVTRPILKQQKTNKTDTKYWGAKLKTGIDQLFNLLF